MTTISRREAGGRTFAPGIPARLGALTRARTAEAAWAVPAMLGVTFMAAVMYLVNLTVSGYANTYYSAAALAGSQSWSAWFFGSIDSANFITVDKPPLATMLMGLSVRLLGLSPWSVLLPQALAGVAMVAVLMLAVRRTFGPAAAVIAGLVAALTPAAVLIFRFNNPDALSTLLLVLSAYAVLRALDGGRLRWVALAGALVGFGFLTKYLQAYFVLPAFAFVWAFAAPGSARQRLAGLVVAALAVVAASGWWVAIMELIPAVSRPFIGGSETNSVVDLLLGYDGLGRIFGQGGGGGGGGGFSGTPGLLRLFNAELGGQVAWLLPLALGATGLGLLVRTRTPRTDLARAGYLLWGLWLLVHAVVFSFMSGIIHSYYVVAMAPAIGALAGAGSVELWRLRERFRWGGIAFAPVLVGSAVLAWALLDRTPDFAPGLGVAVIAVAAAASLVLAIPRHAIGLRTAIVVAGLGLAALLAAPSAYAVDTMQTALSGGDASAGPTVQSSAGLGDGGRAFAGGTPPTAGAAPGDGAGGTPSGGATSGGTPPAGLTGGGPSGQGGTQIDSTLTDYLVANRGSATWIVAVSGANEAGQIELATGLPVMAMGGFTGSDPAPTLEQLQAYVASGQLRFVLIGGGGGGAGFGSSSEISTWVAANGTVVESVGNGTLYDLAGAP
jgi:4-amino-4-deoxy-L-arabinose transferase-like glycosyltransferase